MTRDGRAGLVWAVAAAALAAAYTAVAGLAPGLLPEGWVADHRALVGFMVLGLGVLTVAPVVRATLAERRGRQEAEQHARRDLEAMEADRLRRVRECFMVWPAPAMSQVDPYALGVVRSSLASQRTRPGEMLPPYVPRDRDAVAGARLRGQGLLLIVGAPASGATRTAYELALDASTARVVLAPQAPHGLRRALQELDVLARLEPPLRLLLWLDRVDKFAGGGLTPSMLKACRERSPGLRVVATIPSSVYSAWVAQEAAVAAEFGEPVVLERLPTAGERRRAEAAFPGVDFSEGIAAAFTAVRELLLRLRSGNITCPAEPADGDCPIARALVHTVSSWTATGSSRPLPVSLLFSLVQQRLHLSRGLDYDHLTHALSWAVAPIHSGASLVQQHPGPSAAGAGASEAAVSAHPTLASIVAAEDPPPTTVWDAALREALDSGDSEAIGAIGFHAHYLGRLAFANTAWQGLVSLDEPGAAWLLRAAEVSNARHDAPAEVLARRRLLDLTEAEFGPRHREVARVLEDLGRAHLDLGDPARSRDLLVRALELQELAYGPEHVVVAATLGMLSTAYNDLAEPATARDLLNRALLILERTYGSDDPTVADTLDKLGGAERNLGNAGRARELLEQALPIHERVHGTDHPTTAATVNNLGNVYSDLGNPERARGLFERALPVIEGEYGDHHWKLAAVLYNLGTAYNQLGDPWRARPLLERALNVEQMLYGDHHPSVAATSHNLGNVHIALGNPREGRALLEKALVIQEEAHGLDHWTVAPILSDLATTYTSSGQPTTARELLERALSIQERTYGPEHWKVATTLNNLATVEVQLGSMAGARSLLIRALDLLQAQPGEGQGMVPLLRENLRLVSPDSILLEHGGLYEMPGGEVHGSS